MAHHIKILHTEIYDTAITLMAIYKQFLIKRIKYHLLQQILV